MIYFYRGIFMGEYAMRTFILILVVAVTLTGCFKMDVKVPDYRKELDGAGPSGVPSSNGEEDNSSGGGGWKATAAAAAGKFLGGQDGFLFYAYDTLAWPEKSVVLAARVRWSASMEGIKGVSVAFYQRKKLVGLDKTNSDGIATMKWTPADEGDYRFTAEITNVPRDKYDALLKMPSAPMLVASRAEKTPLVVVDIDHTLVESGFHRVLLGGAKPMADSARVLRLLGRKNTIVYLTHRPDILTRKTKVWLNKYDYPDGPVLLSKLKDVFGDSGKFKTARLSAIKKSFPNVSMGIGDKPSDAQAYIDTGLSAYLIPHYDNDDAEELHEMADEIDRLRGRGRLQVVDDWNQVEMGVFRGRNYPPDAFARKLRRRAERLKEENNDKDDD